MAELIEVKETVQVETNSILTADIVSRWIRWVGGSDKTEMTYRTAIKQLFKYCADNAIARPTRADLENWRDGLIAAKKAASTIRLYITSAKIFFRFLAEEGLYKNIADRLPARVKVNHEHKKDALSKGKSAELFLSINGKSEKVLRDRAIIAQMIGNGVRAIDIERVDVSDFCYLNGECFLRVQGKGHSEKDQLVKIDSHVKALIDKYLKTYPKARVNVEKALRDRAIIALMISTGVRTIEIERADVSDFCYLDGECFLRVQGKGHSEKDQLVRIDSRVKALIDKYLKARVNVASDQPLFTSTARLNKGARISTQTVRKMVKGYLRAIGIDNPRITAHSLRHTAALQMLLGGASLEQVQQSLRHVNINTTMIYNHAVMRMKNPAEIFAADALFDTLDALAAAA